MSQDGNQEGPAAPAVPAAAGPIRRPRRRAGAARVRRRAFCYTLHVTPETADDTESAVQSIECKYHVFGREVCPTTGRRHLQGYIELTRQMDFNSVRSLFPGAPHLEPRAGTPLQASDYCKKDGDFWEMGTLSNARQGTRTDLERCLDSVRSNPSTRRQDVAENHTGVFARYPRFVDSLFGFYRQVDTLDWEQPPNQFIFGEPGVGKSRHARTLYPSNEIYDKGHNKWWDGYDGEPCVLIDDLHPDQAKYLVTYIKLWGDRYPFRAEVKGSSMQIRPAVVVITSNYSVEEMFPNVADQRAVRRRFHITHMLEPLQQQ